jgi:hypothetical protein
MHRKSEHFRPTTALGSGTASTTTSGTPAGDNAGTVTSFDGTTLVVTLNDGSTATGKVTSNTAIGCPSSTGTQAPSSDPANSAGTGGDDQGDQTDQDSQDRQGDRGDQSEPSDQSDGAGSCSANALTPGAAVHEANLKVSSAGKAWLGVKLG